jgi:zinc and cadmium transporter
MTLIAILMATLAAGIGSVWLAAGLMRLGFRGVGSAGAATHVGPQHLLSLAAGALLATAFMHLLPEAFESEAGAVTPLGGLTGWWLVDRLHDSLPYFLAIASSSFIYVALADLIPQLQKRLSARETAVQIFWLLVGIALVTGVSRLAHAR